MKKTFYIVLIPIFFTVLFITGCNTNSKENTLTKFELKDGEKYIELYYDTVEAEMNEVFKFKDINGKVIDFYISYNVGNEWLEIAEKLIKGEKYGLIYKPFSNQKIVDSLQRNNIITDDFPASGDYIYYLQDSKGNMIFKNNFFSIKPSDKNGQAEAKNNSTEIDNKYIEYLNNYGLEGNPEIKFVTIENINYWVTSQHGSGTHQEYFWVLNKNQLIPMFIFEYGGINNELDYTFINIKTNETINGKVIEENLEPLKINFISKNP